MKLFEIFKECCLPFPQKVKFWTAFKWWLSATYRTYKKGRRKFCSECGWPLVYLDDLYDEVYIRESVEPGTIAVCSFCGIEFYKFESWSSWHWAVLSRLEKK